MNNRGQVLVIFVIMLPVFILLGAVIVDTSYMLYQKNRLDNINISVLNSVKNDSDITTGDINNLILENDSDIVSEITIDTSINIDNYKNVSSIFGKIIGLDTYKISSSKSITYTPTESANTILEITYINDYDNTYNYSLIYNDVLYSDGLVFNSSSIIVNDFSLPSSFKLSMEINSTSVSGSLITYNNFNLYLKNSNLYLGDNLITNINLNTNTTIMIDGSNDIYDIYIDDDLITSINLVIDNTTSTLTIGNNYTGIMSYIKIESEE